MNIQISKVILIHLLENKEYWKKVFPYLKQEYFEENNEKVVFGKISSFIDKYNNVPSKEALVIDIDNDKTLTDDEFKSSMKLLDELEQLKNDDLDMQWLYHETERYCKERALQIAIIESISIYEGKDKQKKVGAIPALLSDALAVGFDGNIGHDFFEHSENRFEFYHKVEEKIAFDLDLMNKITKGGLSRKTLAIILAGTGVGKTLAMCHFAANNIMDGKNVLYITLEMSEEKIAERIDSNLMDISMNDLKRMTRDEYSNGIHALQKKAHGKLIIKEYPTAAASVDHFRHLLNELRMKKNFKPDIIYIDYLNIATSQRMKYGSSTGSYLYVKSVAEELRGLAVEFNVPLITATQTNRTGFTDTDPDLTATSESFGVTNIADFMISLVATDDLNERNEIQIKQLKNRYNDIYYYKKFNVGIDRTKMKLYNVENRVPTEEMNGTGQSQANTVVYRMNSRTNRNIETRNWN